MDLNDIKLQDKSWKNLQQLLEMIFMPRTQPSNWKHIELAYLPKQILKEPCCALNIMTSIFTRRLIILVKLWYNQQIHWEAYNKWGLGVIAWLLKMILPLNDIIYLLVVFYFKHPYLTFISNIWTLNKLRKTSSRIVYQCTDRVIDTENLMVCFRPKHWGHAGGVVT